MEKTTTEIVEEENISHSFFCDICGKQIGQSEEWDDGYYVTHGDYSADFLFGHWYRLEMCLCDDCAQKKTNDILRTIKDLGFKWDDSYSVEGEERPAIFAAD